MHKENLHEDFHDPIIHSILLYTEFSDSTAGHVHFGGLRRNSSCRSPLHSQPLDIFRMMAIRHGRSGPPWCVCIITQLHNWFQQLLFSPRSILVIRHQVRVLIQVPGKTSLPPINNLKHDLRNILIRGRWHEAEFLSCPSHNLGRIQPNFLLERNCISSNQRGNNMVRATLRGTIAKRHHGSKCAHDTSGHI